MRRQAGFTLVELMVALATGLLLLLFLVQIYAQAFQNARVQRNIAWMQEDGRTAIEVITNTLRLAGYKPVGTSPLASTTLNTCGNPPGGNYPIVGFETSGLPDSISVAYQDDGFLPRCNADALGALQASPVTTVVCLDVNSTSLRLGCATTSGMQPVLANIENMQIAYGVADALPNIGTIEYLPAASIAAATWSRVVSARINLLVRSRDDGLTPAFQNYRFDANGDGYPEALTAADYRLRQAFTTTVLLRNRLP